jgi:hypothetical protein
MTLIALACLSRCRYDDCTGAPLARSADLTLDTAMSIGGVLGNPITRVRVTRVRGVVAGALIVSLIVGGLAAAMATRADAAPTAIIGPTESFTATVVEGTLVPVGPVIRFNVERPAMANPATLEQLTVESAQASLVIPGEILSVTGNYDTDTKIFKATSMVSLGNSNPARASTSSTMGDNANDNGDDNDNADSDDNGNDNN